MNRSDWAEMHGYQRIHCSRCGWQGYTDTSACENGCDDRCDGCDNHPDECECEGEEGPEKETLRSVRIHRARKTYNEGRYNEIRPGDRYRRVVVGGYVVGGPRWLSVNRTRLEKGPAWQEAA